MTSLVLSLFPGIGLLDRGFEDEGFCVVRGPDLLWGGDVKKFHVPAGKFDGVIGGPPCKAFSPLANLVRAQGREPGENLIPEFERVVFEAQPAWFVMENVRQAPTPLVGRYNVQELVLDNRDCPTESESVGPEQRRVRRFCWGYREWSMLPHLKPRLALFQNPSTEATVTANGTVWEKRPGRKARPYCVRTVAQFEKARRLQGLPEDFDLPPFRVDAKCEAVGNGVPYPLARAVARAVREAVGH